MGVATLMSYALNMQPPIYIMQNMRNTLAIYCALTCGYACAQPVLVQGNLLPNFGSYYLRAQSSYVAPTSQGPNQLWDYSGIGVIDIDTVQFLNPAFVPNSSLFPSTNMVRKDNDAYLFMEYTNDGIYHLGTYANNLVSDFPDIGTVLEFPCTYGTMWSDTYLGVNTNATISASISSEIDAYGFLSFPSVTSLPVLRERQYITATITAGVIDCEIIQNIYNYYATDIPIPVFTIVEDSTICNGNLQLINYSTYLQNISVGIDINQATDQSCPCSFDANNSAIHIKCEPRTQVVCRLLNTQGALLYTMTVPGEATIPTTVLRTGIHLVQLVGDGCVCQYKIAIPD